MRTHDDFMRDFANSSTTTECPQDPSLDEEEDSRCKKIRTIHPSLLICRDWMIVSGNVHYARDKASFTTYTPVNVLLKNNIFSPHDEMQVAGVGDVHLHVQRGRNDPSTHLLVLEGVLHIPEAICNGFNPLLVGSSMSCHPEFWEGADRRGAPMWFGLPFAGMGRLVLADMGGGESDLIEGRQYTLSLYISPEERSMIMGMAQGMQL
ncbi:uncharacterized protein BDV17DRAFT_274096 [Aspergillus undulatus]|uniref:uncharacterized protein n=1 Tax=Aspergillus undulatus TaxID=1810928 RepID=UPI003CCCFE37